MTAMMVSAGQQSGYVPDLDAMLEKKMGICFDFAALMGALLRSQGIPTQMVMGYADITYHAWNNILIDGEWVRYDATLGRDPHQHPAVHGGGGILTLPRMLPAASSAEGNGPCSVRRRPWYSKAASRWPTA